MHTHCCFLYFSVFSLTLHCPSLSVSSHFLHFFFPSILFPHPLTLFSHRPCSIHLLNSILLRPSRLFSTHPLSLQQQLVTFAPASSLFSQQFYHPSLNTHSLISIFFPGLCYPVISVSDPILKWQEGVTRGRSSPLARIHTPQGDSLFHDRTLHRACGNPDPILKGWEGVTRGRIKPPGPHLHPLGRQPIARPHPASLMRPFTITMHF
jgi:hypothetical protein